MAVNHLPNVADHENPSSHIPVECGKIMTVIHNFVPTQENPMVTIRRGLRVKVLSAQADQVTVLTKTGNTFCIPRSHLRLSHKTSDASAFPGTNPPTAKSADQKSDGSNAAVECSHGQAQISPINGIEQNDNTNFARSPVTFPPTNNRGSRVNSTGNQVFELC